MTATSRRDRPWLGRSGGLAQPCRTTRSRVTEYRGPRPPGPLTLVEEPIGPSLADWGRDGRHPVRIQSRERRSGSRTARRAHLDRGDLRSPGLTRPGRPMTTPPRLRRPATALAALSVLLPLLSALRRQDAPRTPDAFEDADLAFREIYTRGRAATLAKLGPVIVVEMDHLVLIRDGGATRRRPSRRSTTGSRPSPSRCPLRRPGPARRRPTPGWPRPGSATFAPDRRRIGVAGRLRLRPEPWLGLGRARALLRLPRRRPGDRPVRPGRADGPDEGRRAARPGQRRRRGEGPDRRLSRPGLRLCGRGPAGGLGPAPRGRDPGPGCRGGTTSAVQYFARLMGLPGESRRLVYAEELTSGEPQAPESARDPPARRGVVRGLLRLPRPDGDRPPGQRPPRSTWTASTSIGQRRAGRPPGLACPENFEDPGWIPPPDACQGKWLASRGVGGRSMKLGAWVRRVANSGRCSRGDRRPA